MSRRNGGKGGKGRNVLTDGRGQVPGIILSVASSEVFQD